MQLANTPETTFYATYNSDSVVSLTYMLNPNNPTSTQQDAIPQLVKRREETTRAVASVVSKVR